MSICAIAYQQEHAAVIEQRLDATSAGTDPVTLHVGDEVYLRSWNWAAWKLGLPRP